MHHVDGAKSVACGQDAIKGAGRAAALDVPQHNCPSFKAGALFNFAGENVGNAAQFGVTKFVLAHVLEDGRSGTGIGGKLCAFRYHDNGEITAPFVALPNRFGNLVDVEGPLGNQDYVCAAGDAAVERDPASIPAHDLDHHHSVVGFRSRMEPVNRFAHDVAGRIKSESVVRATQVVIDRLGHADDLDSAFVKFLGDRQGIIAADRDQRVNFVLVNRCGATLNAVR